jgi:lysophospholipase L1-like esterase
MLRVLVAAAALAVAAACERPAAVAPELPVDEALNTDLEQVSRARVFFAHMSVGANVLDGVARVPDSGLRLLELDAGKPNELAPATFSHALFGQNGDPDAKLRAFETLLNERLTPAPDVALMKFCYADLNAATDTRGLFTRYREMIERLQRAHPATVFVHVTAPLTVRDTGAKDLVKRLTGFKDGFAGANLRRDEYNDRLRASFRDAPVFDLASVESTWPDGRAERFTRGGESRASLVPAYSDDGQHLAPAGQDRAARALIHALAQALRRERQ